MELSVNPGPKPIGHVVQASIALQKYKIIRNIQAKKRKNDEKRERRPQKKRMIMATFSEVRKRLGMDSRVGKVKCHTCGKELKVPNQTAGASGSCCLR